MDDIHWKLWMIFTAYFPGFAMLGILVLKLAVAVGIVGIVGSSCIPSPGSD